MKTNEPIVVSVVMSCYNGERWLAESIGSILAQSFKNFEFIIVDDGSKDKTREIIEKYANIDKRIIGIYKQNTGLADSLNVAIASARGDYIARIDADDRCLTSRIEKQVRIASAQPNIVYIGAGLYEIDEFGRRLSKHLYPTKHQRLVKHLLTLRKFPAHSSAFFRRDAFERVGGYRSRISRAEDWDLWLRLSNVGQLVAVCEALVELRRHNNQVSHVDGGVRQREDALVAVVSHWLRMFEVTDPVNAEKESYEEFRKWLSLRLREQDATTQAMFSRRVRLALHDWNIADAFYLILNASQDPRLAFNLVKLRMRGSEFPREVALKWISRSSNLSVKQK